jgi:hypothetical protein
VCVCVCARVCACVCVCVHGVSDIRQSEIQTPETLLSESTSCGVEFAIAKLKM